jgi:hypothetical protein
VSLGAGDVTINKTAQTMRLYFLVEKRKWSGQEIKEHGCWFQVLGNQTHVLVHLRQKDLSEIWKDSNMLTHMKWSDLFKNTSVTLSVYQTQAQTLFLGSYCGEDSTWLPPGAGKPLSPYHHFTCRFLQIQLMTFL